MKNRRIDKTKYQKRIGDKKPIPREINRSRNKCSKLDQSLTSASSYKCKPFIKWAGGKTQLFPVIDKSLPPSIQNKQCYVEPFVGGGAVLFWLLRRFTNFKLVVISDINYELITAYRVVKKFPHKLIKYLKAKEQEYYSIPKEGWREYFLKQRDLFNRKIGDQIENAGLLIFLNKTCYNGLYRVNKKNVFNVNIGKHSTPPRICDESTLIENSKILKRVKIIHADFAQTLKYAGSGSFFFIDPPYKPISDTSSFTSYSSTGFNDDEQVRLSEYCIKLDRMNTQWLLCNSDSKNTEGEDNLLERLYKGFNIKRVEARRNINSKGNKRGKRSELLISNY